MDKGSHPVANCSGKQITDASWHAASAINGLTFSSEPTGSSHTLDIWAIHRRSDTLSPSKKRKCEQDSVDHELHGDRDQQHPHQSVDGA